MTERHNAEATPSFLIISGHDYRSKRQANIHFIARELAKRGPTRFFSVGFSSLSKIKKDPRLSLWDEANSPIVHEGVECFLWRTLLHPVNLGRVHLSALERLWFSLYIGSTPRLFRQWVKEASVIVIESGMGIAFFDRMKRINPGARFIYRCSDTLATVGCATSLQEDLRRQALRFDSISLPSSRMKDEFPPGSKFSLVPHGLDTELMDRDVPSPYPEGLHVVSIGSMLFDATFFHLAAPAFPHVTFHIIGGGRKAESLHLPNVRIYGETAFKETLPYLKHAKAGVAPYEGSKVAPYLVDTSLKLKQFAYLGLPAVCPEATVGGYKGRFGYEPGNKESICAAIHKALTAPKGEKTESLTWSAITDRLLE